MCANLANRSTITKMASYLWNFGKIVIKCMHIQCHAPTGLGNSCKGRLVFGKKFGSPSIYPSLHKVGYILLYAWPIEPPWHHSMTVYSSLWRAIEISHFYFQTNSLNLPCGTYTRFFVCLSNPFTNLTFLNVLPLRSSPRSFCGSRWIMYPFYFVTQVSFTSIH